MNRICHVERVLIFESGVQRQPCASRGCVARAGRSGRACGKMLVRGERAVIEAWRDFRLTINITYATIEIRGQKIRAG